MDTPATEKNNLATVVFDAIAEDIAQHKILPGEKLPSENNLAVLYGVSRVTVRTALHMLAALGMIETRNGGGSYVKKFKFSDVTDRMSKIMSSQTSTKDITEYRNLIEAASISKIKERNQLPSDFKYLKKCCDQMRKAYDKDSLIDMTDADFKFHRKICEMSGNFMFVYSYDMLSSIKDDYFLSRYPRLREEDIGRKMWKDAIEIHEHILQCLKEGRYDEAEQVCAQMTTEDGHLHWSEKENYKTDLV